MPMNIGMTDYCNYGCKATASVKKKRGALMAPGRELALWVKAGIAINRPFWFFCGYDKRTGPSGQEETKEVYQH